MRRKIVARYRCPTVMTVEEVTPFVDDFNVKDTSTDLNDSEAVTRPSTPRNSERPRSLLRWNQKQYFPLGIVKEANFVSDGVSEWENDDSDTGHWKTVTYVTTTNYLIQKRVSESLGLIMYDTRCTIKAPLNLAKLKENIIEFVEVEEQKSLKDNHDPDSLETMTTTMEGQFQLFQWKLIDRLNEDNVLSCTYHLKRTKN